MTDRAIDKDKRMQKNEMQKNLGNLDVQYRDVVAVDGRVTFKSKDRKEEGVYHFEHGGKKHEGWYLYETSYDDFTREYKYLVLRNRYTRDRTQIN